MTPFQHIRVCSGDEHATQGGSRCYAHNFGAKWNSALEMWTECGKSRARTVNGKQCQVRDGALKQGMLRTFGVSGQRDCAMQLPGFSVVGQDSARSRWGWMSNLPSQGCQPGDNEDSDGAIGIGLNAQSGQCACGAGNTAWFSVNQPYTGCRFCDNAWVWVKA